MGRVPDHGVERCRGSDVRSGVCSLASGIIGLRHHREVPTWRSPKTRTTGRCRHRSTCSIEEIAHLRGPPRRRTEARARARGAAARDQGPAGPSRRPEREAELHAARGPRAHRHPPRRGRQAHPAAVGVRRDRRQERRRHGRRPHERPQDEGRAAPRHRPRRSSSAAARSSSTRASTSSSPATPEITGEVVTIKEVMDDGVRALVVGRADEERVCELADTAARHPPAHRRHDAPRPPLATCCSRSCPGPRSRTCCSRRCPTSPTTTSAGSTTRSSRSPMRSSCRSSTPTCSPSTAAGAEGDPALRPARVRQDADRQGRRQQPGQEGRRHDRRREGPQLLHQHQGPRAAQQVRRRDRAPDPPRVPARPGEERGGLAGHRVLRRDGLDVPHPRLRHLLRHGVDDRAAAARRDRRRRGSAQRHRDRRDEPRGPHRPGDPAPRPARREDQDRAPERGRPRRRSSPSTSPTRSRSPPARRCPT